MITNRNEITIYRFVLKPCFKYKRRQTDCHIPFYKKMTVFIFKSVRKLCLNVFSLVILGFLYFYDIQRPDIILIHSQPVIRA